MGSLLARAVAVLCLIATAAAAADWKVGKAPGDVGADQAGQAVNLLGDKVFVWKKNQEGKTAVFGAFLLGENKHFANSMPKVQVDRGMIIPVDQLLVPGTSDDDSGWATIGDNRVVFKLWEGPPGKLGQKDSFYSWFSGDRVRLIYNNEQNIEQASDFNLKGAATVLTQVTGVK